MMDIICRLYTNIHSIIGCFFLWLFNPIIEFFRSKIYSQKILFNCTWEDPLLDIEALEITEKDTLMSITSAGCNILTYVLQKPKHIYAVDANPCQNALLQLKIASIKELDFATFWEMWGRGKLPRFSEDIYPRLRIHLTQEGKHFWDSHTHYFNPNGMRSSFYWRGCSGLLAYMFGWYLWLVGVSKHIDSIFNATTIEEQKMIYEKYVKRRMWNSIVLKCLTSEFVLSFLNGIPAAQQNLIEQKFEDILQNAFQTVFTRLSLTNNYFYRVYAYGEYTKECCPEYLNEENFNQLKNGLIDRISIHTTTVTMFLKEHQTKDISRFILLDHMDWMAAKPDILSEEWQQILDCSTDSSRFIWRSVSLNSTFIDNTSVVYDGKATTVKGLIRYNPSLASKLHESDRVQTYAAFFIAYLRR